MGLKTIPYFLIQSIDHLLTFDRVLSAITDVKKQLKINNMLKNFLSGRTKKILHCENNGNETTIDKTRILTKISGVINLRMFDNPKVDNIEKVIHSDSKPPIKF